ncbi:MAG TPA: aromatic ring-hydroxylating dioxygenase subunit alpha [Candidatus Acidoferrales bacterium]|nr:aromatic ring-hydroxylating dioxygenase subunit alpha [Candidatus Acidoferrales bacterium]
MQQQADVNTKLVSALKEYWYIAARATELRSRPLARTVLGVPLVLFREADGKAAALIDRCAHRNMALSRGRVCHGTVECSYHGWRYRGDGTCVEIPSMANGAAEPANVKVQSFPTAERDGFVWVYMGSSAPAGPPRAFPHYGDREWTTFTMETRFEASAFACLENFLDCPHTVFVHTTWFRSRAASEVRARVRRRNDGVDVEFFNERDAQSVVSRLLFPADKKMVHTDRFLMPTTSRVDYSFGADRHFIITSQCTPVSESETEVYTVVTFRFGRIGWLVRLLFAPLARRIIAQDVKVLKAQTEQLRRFGAAEFTFVKSDLVGPHIWELWQGAARNGGDRPRARTEEETEVILRF